MVCMSSSSLLIGRRPVYTSVSVHLFIGRPRFLFPMGILSCTFLTNWSSVTRDMCRLHSILPLCTQEVMFWISRFLYSMYVQLQIYVIGKYNVTSVNL
jgi:hypothetical protein